MTLTVIEPLQLRPRILPGESPAAHLMRMFEINGEPWSRERLRSRGLSITQVFDGSSDAAFRAFKIDLAPFAKTAARVHSYKLVTVAGEQLHRDDWSTLVRRWCPQCFEEDLRNESLGGRSPGWRVHRRFWWDAVCVTTCPIHAVRLERECPVCGDPVKWDTGSLTACRDQHSLLGCKPVEVAHRDVAADAYVVGRLGGAARMAVPFLDALPLRDAIDAMEHFGLAAEGDPFAAMSKLNDERHPEIRSVGLRIAVGWPDAFDAVLDRLASRPEIGVGVWGQDSIYGYLVAWARARRKTALGKAVLDAILSHFARRTSVRAGSAAEQFVDENSPFSLIQVADALGIADSAAKAYLIGVGLWPQKTKRGSPVLFPRSIVKEMKEALADQIGVGELPSLLGIGPPQVKVLVATGILRRLPLKLMKSGSYPRYSRAEIAAWIERLAGGAPTVGAIPSGLTSLMFTCRHMTAGGIAGIVTLIDEGRIKVRGRLAKVPGLRSFLVDFAEVRRAVRVKTGGELSPREAAKELGLHLESVWACIRLGLLDHTRLGAQQAVVSREAIAKFRSTYVTATEIAKELSTANRWVISVLKAAGCEPEASRASSPRCRVSLYRRADIPADLAERFRQLREKK